MNTPHESDPFAFNDRLRSVYDADENPTAATPPLPPQIWAGVRAHLHPVAPAPALTRRGLLLGGATGLVLGVLLMGFWGNGPAPQTAASRTNQPTSLRSSSGDPANLLHVSRRRSGTPANLLHAIRSNSGGHAHDLYDLGSSSAPLATPPTGSIVLLTTSTAADSSTREPAAHVPPTHGTAEVAVPGVLAPLVQIETTYAAASATDSAAERANLRAARRAALLLERAALLALTRRADSLLLTLGEVAISTDSLPPSQPPTLKPSKWSVALAFAPERNFFGLSAPAGDSLAALRRTHEQGRGGWNANLMAEYRLDERLSVGAGVGVASVGAELRLTDVRTTVQTRYDTIHTIRIDSVSTIAYAINPVPDSILAPIVNFNNEIIGYEYLPTTRLDTVWTHLTNTEITNTNTVTPTVVTRQERTARVLRPNYRFLTVPLLVRYRLGRATDWTSSPTAPRWWADVAVGAQLQWFLGGTQATTLDGLTYRTERVGPRGGLFRPLNVALTGAVALNYALTPRLSASVAPTLRYQLESVYKASTNLSQKPTATGVQVGLKLAF